MGEGRTFARLDSRGRPNEDRPHGDSYRLCYVRGAEGIIVELAEQIA
jgi:hypothetical protein